MSAIKGIANSFAEEYCSDAIYPSHLFKAVLHKSMGLVHFLETDLDKDYYRYSVLSTIFGGGMSSRLFQEIREKRGLVYTISSFNQALKNAGVFGIYAGTTPKELNELLPVVATEIKKLTNDKVSEAELKRAKTQIKASLLMSLESSSTTAEIMARQMLLFKRIIPTEEIVAKIEAITADELLNLAQRIFVTTPTYALLVCVGHTFPGYDEVCALLNT